MISCIVTGSTGSLLPHCKAMEVEERKEEEWELCLQGVMVL